MQQPDLLAAVDEREMRKRKVGLYFFNAGSLNEAVRIELVGERQRGDPKTQQRKNRITGEEAKTGQNG
jgi:hypothetical protein